MITITITIKRLNEKWELADEHLLATLIHPNLKHFHMCPNLKERAIYLLKQEMIKRQGDAPPSSTMIPSITTSPSTTVTLSSLSSLPNSSSSTPNAINSSSSARKNILMEIYDKQSLVVPGKTNIEEELENYLSSTSVINNEEEDNILLYWREHRLLFPTIASIARDVLAIPASNTCVE